MAGGLLPGLLFLLHAAARLAAEQEVENLSGLSPNPEKDIFVVRENRTTCLMAEFAAKLIVPYDVWASNYVDMITEQADIPLSRGAEVTGKCGTNESELEISWLKRAYTLKLFFLKEGHNTSRGQEAFWRLSQVQFTYNTAEPTYFKEAVNPARHTVTSHELSALVTPAGKSYECQAQQTISLTSKYRQKPVQLLLSEVRVQPFDITSDFVFSEANLQLKMFPDGITGSLVLGGGLRTGRRRSSWRCWHCWRCVTAVTSCLGLGGLSCSLPNAVRFAECLLFMVITDLCV